MQEEEVNHIRDPKGEPERERESALKVGSISSKRERDSELTLPTPGFSRVPRRRKRWAGGGGGLRLSSPLKSVANRCWTGTGDSAPSEDP
jgi:hypothetical protein